MNNDVAPVIEGEEIDVRIDAIGGKGDGIARKKGFVIFIPNVKAGDEVRVKIKKVLKNASFGEVIGPALKPIKVPSHAAPVVAAPPKIESPEDTDDFGSDLDDDEDFE